MKNKLSKNWKEFKLIDVAPVSDSRVKLFTGKKEYIATGDLFYTEILSSTEITFQERPSRADLLLAENEVLFAKMMGTKKILCGNVVNKNYIYSTGFFILKPVKGIYYKYLYYFFISDYFNEVKDKNCTGATQKALTLQGLRKINILLPIDDNGELDIEEQKRVVSILEAAEQLRNKREEINKKMLELIPSLFVEMFSDQASNSMGWDKKELRKVCEPTRLINLERLNKNSFKYIDISSIDNKKGVINDPKIINKDNAPSRARQQIRLGDVLISTVRPNLKNVACVNIDYDQEICSTGFCILRPLKNLVTSEYLFAISQSSMFTNYLQSLVLGANYPAVKNSDIFKYKVLIPPISKQKEFTTKIKNLEKLKTKQNEFNDKINILFNSLLYKAFSGRL